jgi:RimJ/RimL family protein N-acetyltransferase
MQFDWSTSLAPRFKRAALVLSAGPIADRVRRRFPAVAQTHLRLPDGSPVLVRPIREDDAQAYAHAFTRLSTESRRRRFLNASPRLAPCDVRYLTAVDQDEHVALVAVEPGAGEILGSVRYVRIAGGPADAELAIEVIDDWQGRGLGRALLSALAAHALAHGLRRFTALVAADNRSMQAACKRAVVAVERGFGELEYVLDVGALATAPTGCRALAARPSVVSVAAALLPLLQPAATPA